jgi:hypothetical protein
MSTADGGVGRLARWTPDPATITHFSLTVGGTGPRAAQLPLKVRDREYRLDPRGTLQVPLQRPRG